MYGILMALLKMEFFSSMFWYMSQFLACSGMYRIYFLVMHKTERHDIINIKIKLYKLWIKIKSYQKSEIWLCFNWCTFRYFFSIVIGITQSDGYPDNFIKGKLCMMKNIEEFSASFQKKRDSRNKYRLVMIVLMFLLEMSNQYFYLSARSEWEHI